MMHMFGLLLLLLLSSASSSAAVGEPLKSSNWAVLVAGSNGYYNYRHQADISHAYQILTQMGHFPASNIVTMMYNDIADSAQNPLPGRLYNEPGGVDVYQGVVIDYQGEEVTARNFLNVLKGTPDKKDQKVLKSGERDNVFIYYSDHGATGLVAMPSGPPLYADELMKSLQAMHEQRQYKQLVFYLEACESGSMFNNILPPNTSIFATTASNPVESSYAYYYNATLQTYMADEYSIRWMQDSTQNWQPAIESLLTQFKHVQAVVNESHPQQYGDVSFDEEAIEDFEAYEDRPNQDQSKRQGQGLLFGADGADYNYSNSNRDLESRISSILVDWYLNFKQAMQHQQRVPASYVKHWRPSPEAVGSRDVVLATLQHRYLDSKTLAAKAMNMQLIELELENRMTSDILFSDLIAFVIGSTQEEYVRAFVHGSLESAVSIDFECLRSSYAMYERQCARPFDDYSLKYVRALVNLCAVYGTDAIALGFYDVCVLEPAKEEIEQEIYELRG